MALLFGVVIFFSLYRLTESPSVWYDEGEFIQLSSNLANHGISGLQLAPGHIEHISIMTVGYPLIYPLALLFKVFGESVLVARSLMVLFILGFVTAGYFLAKRLFGSDLALGTLALLATFPPLYGNGKSVLGEVPGMFFAMISLLFFNLARSDRRRATYWFVAAGLFLGFCVSTKPIFLVFLPAVAIVLFLKWQTSHVSVRQVGLFGLGLLPPLIVWFITQFGTLATFFSVLSFYSNPYATNVAGLVGDNIKLLFTNAGPLYLMVMVLVWSIAILRRKRMKQVVSFSELTAYVATLLFISSYLHVIGWFRYLFPAQAIALIFFPASLETVIDWVAQKFPIIGRLRQISVVVIIGLLSIVGAYGLIFNSWVADFYHSYKTAFWEDYFARGSAEESLFFYDTPEIAIFSRHRNYYQYLEPAGGPFGKEQLLVVNAGLADKIIVETDNFEKKKEWFLKNYHPTRQVYKYSILEKNTKSKISQ